jgi:hypothetical protein
MVPSDERQAGHETFAAAIAASAAVGAALAGPIGAPAVELVSAALTGAVAIHALGDESLVRRGVHRMTRDSDAPLAAHAIDFALRARRGDPRMLRAAAMIVGRCASDHAAAIVAHVAFGWSNPFKSLATAASAARAAVAGADLVRDLTHAAIERDPIVIDSQEMSQEMFELAVNDASQEVAA